MTFKRPYSAGLAALAVGMFAATAAYACLLYTSDAADE